ncbi:MAG: amidase [Jatrophihabitantaceae bacterium]
MMSSPEQAGSGQAADAHFAAAARRLGLEVPADLLDGVLRGHRGLQQLAVLVGASTACDDPTGVGDDGFAGRGAAPSREDVALTDAGVRADAGVGARVRADAGVGADAAPGQLGDLGELSVAQAAALLRSGRLSSVELTRHALDRIAAVDGELNSFVLVTGEMALARAAAADDELRRGVDRGPLHGIPYAHKDIIDVAGLPTGNGSWRSTGQAADADSAIEASLRRGGAVLLGKLTTYEFAVGGPSFDLPTPPARNPWSSDHVPSGSSSGAGAAVAAGLLRVAYASDTSGSIRGPAFHCGAVGLKPTYGRVSGAGVRTLSHTLDHFGPIGWTVGDVAAALQVVAGYDPRDPRTAPEPVADYIAAAAAGAGEGVAGLRVAHTPSWYAEDPATSPEIVATIRRVLDVLAAHGAIIEEAPVPDYELFNACGRVLFSAEAFATHERGLCDEPRSFGRFTYQRLAPGAGLLGADLAHAFALRRRLRRELDRVLSRHDLIVTACGQTTAARFDDFPRDWPPPKLANDMQTIPFSVTGHPAMTLPTAVAGNGLPIGVQLVAARWDEATLFRAGALVEAELAPHRRRPDAAALTPLSLPQWEAAEL